MRRRTAKLTWLRLGSHHPLRVTPKRSTQTAQALLSLGAPVMCLLVVEPQISMGKVARTNVAVIRKVIATPSKIH